MSAAKTQPQPDVFSETARYLDYFVAMTEVGKALTSNLDVSSVLQVIMKSVSQLLSPANWSLMLVDRDANELYFEICVGEAADAIRSLRLPIGEGIAGWVAAHGQAVVCPDVHKDPRFTRRVDSVSQFSTESIVCVPLVCRGEVLGIIELVQAKGAPPFEPSDLQILEPFADFAAIAIDNARSFQAVESLTVTDDWTGLRNARYLESTLQKEINAAMVSGGAVSIIFLDLDHFKEINDAHGHAVSSGALREVGRVLASAVRDSDHTIRYGGDEFVVILGRTGKERALFIAERIRAALERTSFPDLADGSVHITASIGVASYPEDMHADEGVLGSADRAMYEAKSRGRNRVVDASDLSAPAGT